MNFDQIEVRGDRQERERLIVPVLSKFSPRCRQAWGLFFLAIRSSPRLPATWVESASLVP